MKLSLILLLLLLFAAFAQGLSGQQMQSRSSNQQERRRGAIAGRVISSDGQPIANAEISATRLNAERWRRWVTSDEEGNFILKDLLRGAYYLSARMPGYVSADLPFENAVHRTGENVIISMVKGGVITGRVTDETGEPLVGVIVSQHCLRTPDGKAIESRNLMYQDLFGRTDDRGIYRIYGLPPGVYIVSIGHSIGDLGMSQATQVWRDAPTYYPSATRDTAIEIPVHEGEEVSGIDIRDRGERGRLVSGYFRGGDVLSYRTVWLRGLDGGLDTSSDVYPNSGGFAFFGVPDGEYELIAKVGEQNFWARRRISVKGSDVSGIELKAAPGGSIAGRVLIESADLKNVCANDGENQASGRPGRIDQGRSFEEITLRAVLSESGQPAPQIFFDEMLGCMPNANGEFTLKNLEPSRYRIDVDLPDDTWYIRSIKQTGATSKKNSLNDFTLRSGDKFSGVEVVIGEGAGALSGRVIPAKGELPSPLRTCLIPAEAANEDDMVRYASVVTNDGAFAFKHIAPGKYLVHTRQEQEAKSGQTQDAIEKLRREAVAAKNEIEIRPCQRIKDYVLRYRP
ncbi:MAG: carboxypeptidase regulatory-like domain-containing protein [Blastocatellia bacterium]|nr:carboxypeptidase regulatory-like domain-containing protein [Blastocatellia bacterium]